MWGQSVWLDPVNVGVPVKNPILDRDGRMIPVEDATWEDPPVATVEETGWTFTQACTDYPVAWWDLDISDAGGRGLAGHYSGTVYQSALAP